MIESLLNYSDTYGSFFPLIALIIYKNKVAKEVFILLWYFIISILIFGYSNYLADKRINNLFLYHIFSILELTLLLAYFKEIIESTLVKKITTWIIFGFLIFSFLNVLFLEKINSLNSNSQSLEFLLLIVFCFIYYRELANSEEVIIFYSKSTFWIVTGFFIYFSCTLIVFSLYKYTGKQNQSFISNFWIFQEIMYLVKNLFITYGILCFKKTK